MNSESIPVALCYPPIAARTVSDSAVLALAESISETGLLNPITVRRVKKSRAGQVVDAFEVIAGLHRLKAFRKLSRETIPAFVQDMDDARAELAMIDENLCRSDLSPAERAAAHARRKAIYQQLHPESKHGAAGNGRTKEKLSGQLGHSTPAPSFDEAAAKATGQSERAIRRDVARGEAIGPSALAKVVGTTLDKGDELDALAKLPESQRVELIQRAAKGQKVTAKAKVTQKGAPEGKTKLTAWISVATYKLLKEHTSHERGALALFVEAAILEKIG